MKRSIEVAKEDIELRSKREAVTLAADRCEVFANTIVDKVSNYFQQIVDAASP